MGFILLSFGMLVKFAIDIIRLYIEKILNINQNIAKT